MKISNINRSANSFKACHCKFENRDEAPPPVRGHVYYIAKILNETRAKDITVYLNVDNPNPDKPDDFYVKVKTNMKHKDIEKLQKENPDITEETYSRRSPWFHFDKTLMHEVFDYVRRQSEYLRHVNAEFNEKYGIPESEKDIYW